VVGAVDAWAVAAGAGVACAAGALGAAPQLAKSKPHPLRPSIFSICRRLIDLVITSRLSAPMVASLDIVWEIVYSASSHPQACRAAGSIRAEYVLPSHSCLCQALPFSPVVTIPRT
jgi:hypothetical protein